MAGVGGGARRNAGPNFGDGDGAHHGLGRSEGKRTGCASATYFTGDDGQGLLDRLEVTNGMAELNPVIGVLHTHVQCSFGGAGQRCSGHLRVVERQQRGGVAE